MTEFTASNGIPVIKKEWGYCLTTGMDLGVMTGVSNSQFDALREYFRDERDRELGRWRDPKSPNVVIYPHTEEGSVRVVNEADGYEERWTRGQVKQVLNEVCFGYDEARAYFAAHPEKKPWHDAKPGEVWVVDFEAGVTEAVVVPPSGWVKGLAVVAARRIWPESKES